MSPRAFATVVCALGVLWLVGSVAAAQDLLQCGVPVVHRLDVGSVDLYHFRQPGDRVVVNAVDISGNIGLLRLRARLADGTDAESCSGVLKLNNAVGGVSVSDCIPNTATDVAGRYTVELNVVSQTPGNCGVPLPCGDAVAGALQIPGEVDAYTFDVARVPDTVKVAVGSSTAIGGLRMRIFDPNGMPVDGGGSCEGVVGIEVARPGTYTVLVGACARPFLGPYTIGFRPSACAPPPASIKVGSTAGIPGQVVGFEVLLNTMGWTVVATQNDISFEASAPIASADDGAPDCAVNPDIKKAATGFSFRPPGCTPSVDCTGIRTVVVALDNVDPIPDGSVLYTCNVVIGPDAATGTYPLTCSAPGASDPASRPVPAVCTDGAIDIVPLPPPCAGDCDGDGEVTVDEIVRGVNILLEVLPVSECPSFDHNRDGEVTVDELVAGVIHALDGCPVPPVATD